MKKKLLLIMMLISAICLVGCNKQAASEEIVHKEEIEKEEKEESKDKEVIEELNEEELKRKNAQENPVMMGNPLTQVSKEELQKETGLIIDAPYGVEDAEYFVLQIDDKKTAQVVFNVGEYELTYRAEATDLTEGYDTTGLYYEWDEEKEKEVGHCKANLMICDEARALYWLDEKTGINYSFSTVSDIDEGQFVGLANLCFAATNEEVDSKVLFEPVDYEGEYENENGDEVSITRNEDGSYAISISIVRLCLLEGEANDLDASAEFLVKDPNGKDMTGNFHKNEDDTYSFIITGSTWEYINNQDEFTGFVRK